MVTSQFMHKSGNDYPCHFSIFLKKSLILEHLHLIFIKENIIVPAPIFELVWDIDWVSCAQIVASGNPASLKGD